MTISLPDSAKALIEAQASRSGYSSAQEYLLSLVERDRIRAVRDEIETALAEAIDAPSTPLTTADWDDIRTQGRRLIDEGKAR